MKNNFNRRLRNKETPFRPDHAYIENAVEEYLREGGVITELRIDTADLPSVMENDVADEFLAGR